MLMIVPAKLGQTVLSTLKLLANLARHGPNLSIMCMLLTMDLRCVCLVSEEVHRQIYNKGNNPPDLTYTNHRLTALSTRRHRSIVSRYQPSYSRFLANFTGTPSVPMQNFDSIENSEIPFLVGQQQVVVSADITYSYYPFISIGNLHNVMPQDVNYLDSQGCLRIPTRAILDEFMQQYFLHVHPLLPFLSEGDFWNLYCQQGGGGSNEKMSLLVFQAMMFSCCNVS